MYIFEKFVKKICYCNIVPKISIERGKHSEKSVNNNIYRLTVKSEN